MARRLDAPARSLSPEKMSFKDRVDWRQAAFDDTSSEVLSRVKSNSLDDVKMAPEKAIDDKAIEEAPEQLSSELLRELIDGQREQTAKLARIEARIGELEQHRGSAVAPMDGAQRPDDSDEDVSTAELLADDEEEEKRRERFIKKFASSEVYGSIEQDSFHRHARLMVDIEGDSHNGQPSPKQLPGAACCTQPKAFGSVTDRHSNLGPTDLQSG